MVWNHFRNKNFHKCRSGDKHRSHLFHRAPRISYLARSQQGCSVEDFREFVILRFILSLQSPLHTFVLGSSMNILSLANEPFQCSPSIFRRRQSPLQQGRAVLSQKCSPNWFSQLFWCASRLQRGIQSIFADDREFRGLCTFPTGSILSGVSVIFAKLQSSELEALRGSNLLDLALFLLSGSCGTMLFKELERKPRIRGESTLVWLLFFSISRFFFPSTYALRYSVLFQPRFGVIHLSLAKPKNKRWSQMKRWCVSDSESEKELPFLGSILNLYVRSLHSSLGWLRSKLRYSFFYRGGWEGELSL